MPLSENTSKKTLLAVVEQGGYPDFTALYEAMGFNVVMVKTPRKAISYLKKNSVFMLVAEFNFQTDFRDRTSSLESIMASVQHQQLVKHFKNVRRRLVNDHKYQFPADG